MTDPRQAPGGGEGIVWLVGAGPGDPGLITVKGLDCLRAADVIVYDSLANPALLEHARPECEIVDAGKRAGQHTMPQGAINELLCRSAQAGKRVCRLKGGDPFVFGRGGEEALHLAQHGVPFEIVPGVTSAVAAPAYAGIPVTHRGAAVSVRFVTGHEDPTKPHSDLDWDELARTTGTLVFLMAVRNLRDIAARLVAGGRPADTPAALVAEGTLPRQHTVSGTLGDIAARAEEAGVRAPAVLVVGEVARLREQLAWFERKPLFGRRIVVTRARRQAMALSGTLEAAGAEAISFPVIRIESLADSEPMRRVARSARDAHWIVFTSVNGVEAFLEAIAHEGLDVRALDGPRIAAIGPATAERLHQMGLHVDLIPEEYVAEKLLETLADEGGLSGKRFILPRAESARPVLADGLRERGAEVVEAAAYRTLPVGEMANHLIERFIHNEIDLVTFTSSSTVRNFIESIPADRRGEVLKCVRAASIGPVTSDTLREAGLLVEVAASESTIPGLVDGIIDYFQP